MPISAPAGDSTKRPEQATPFARPLFLYVKIPVRKDLIDKFHRWDDEIDQVLRETGIGSVLGWGGSLGAALPDGSREVAFTRIDINVTDLAAARAILQAVLPVIGTPTGTEIHYTIEHRNLEDVYTQAGWFLEQPVFGSRHSLGFKGR